MEPRSSPGTPTLCVWFSKVWVTQPSCRVQTPSNDKSPPQAFNALTTHEAVKKNPPSLVTQSRTLHVGQTQWDWDKSSDFLSPSVFHLQSQPAITPFAVPQSGRGESHSHSPYPQLAVDPLTVAGQIFDCQTVGWDFISAPARIGPQAACSLNPLCII